MGQVSTALGSDFELSFEGKSYTFSPWKYKVQALFERYLEKEAFDVVNRLSAHLTVDERKEMKAIVIRDVAVGTYTFGSPELMRALQSNRHAKKFIEFALKVNHPEVNEEFVDRLYDSKAGEIWDGVNAVGGSGSEDETDPLKGTMSPEKS